MPVPEFDPIDFTNNDDPYAGGAGYVEKLDQLSSNFTALRNYAAEVELTVESVADELTQQTAADVAQAEAAKSISINNALAAATSAASIADYSARVLAKLKTRGIPGSASIVFKKREGFERQVQAAYPTETRPTGRFLGDYATATLAWAAAYLGVATVAGDYYWNTTNDAQEQCTTSNVSTEVFRGAQNYLPDECVFVTYGTGTSARILCFDLTNPLMPMWAKIVSATNNAFPGTSGTPAFTAITLRWDNGKLWWGTGPSAQAGSMLNCVDFKTGAIFSWTGSSYRTYAGGFESRNSALGYKTISTAAGYLISADYIADVAVSDGYAWVATSGGMSLVKPDGTTLKGSSTNAFKSCAILRGRGYAINDTASPESLIDFGPIDQLTASFAAVNTWTNATVPALSDSTLTKVVAAGDHLVIHGSTAVDELWPDTTTMANSLIARKYATAATVPVKKPELMAICSTNTGSIVDTDITVNGVFAADTGWTKSAGVTIAAGVCTFTGVASGQGIYQTGASMAIGDSFVYELTINSITGSIQPHVAEYDVNLGAVISAPGTYTGTFIGPLRSATSRIGIKAVGVATCEIDNFVVRKAVSDFSKLSNHLTPHGTITLTAHATGGVAMASGLSAVNYLSALYDADLDVGTGDFCIAGAFKNAGSASAETLVMRSDAALAGNRVNITKNGTTNVITFNINGSAAATSVSSYGDSLPHTFLAYRKSGVAYLEIDGAIVASGANTASVTNATAITVIGANADLSSPFSGSIALVQISAVAPTASEAAEMHKYMRNLIEGKAAFDELPSNLAYNELTDTIHCVGTTYEQTMRDGRVAVVGSHGVGTSPVIACGPRGEVSYGGSTNLTISVPERNLHEAENPPLYEEKMFYDEELSLEGTIYWLPVGWEVVSVKLDGAESRKNKGSTVYGWALQQDAFRWGVDPTAAITNIAVVAGRYI